ncbi:MAG: hypothetical protein HC944_03060 [Nanoarchaeota archaeon]|nr:hypothetical protein [Nanoarchaeota archaeon]
MSDKIWLGAIYLKDEGGYEIILRSLEHYKKRLKTLGNSPELKDSAAMFGSLLQQEAMKTIPKVDEMLKKIKSALTDTALLNSLSGDRSFMVKALSCYESDITKAQDYGHEYFLKLVGDLPTVRKDLDIIKNALDKINQFSV